MFLDEVLTGFRTAPLQPDQLFADGPDDSVDIVVGRFSLFAPGARPGLGVHGGRGEIARTSGAVGATQ